MPLGRKRVRNVDRASVGELETFWKAYVIKLVFLEVEPEMEIMLQVIH